MATQNHHLYFSLEKQTEKQLWEYLYRLTAALLILFSRYFLTRFIFVPIGLRSGLTDFKTKKPTANPILEQAYSKSKKWTPDEILGLSKRLDITQDEVEQWLHLRSSQNKVTLLEKFVDSFWKVCYYSFEILCGFVVLWDKHWVWDLSECWKDLHNHIITNDVWWYFLLSSSHSWSQLLGLLLDVKRKDFSVMIAHHLVVFVLSIFWIRSNMYRIGAVVSIVTNFPEPFLEGSKMAKYLEYEKTAVFVFLLFALMWVIVRLGLHPLWLIKSYIVDVPNIVPPIFTLSVYYGMAGFVALFFILNCVWTYFVIKAGIHIFVTGEGQDSRSDSEDEE